MNDQQLSQLTGIPVEQIATYNQAQRQQLMKVAHKKFMSPYIDSMNKLAMETESLSMEDAGFEYTPNGWRKIITVKNPGKPKFRPKGIPTVSIEGIHPTDVIHDQYYMSVVDPYRANVTRTQYTYDLDKNKSHIDIQLKVVYNKDVENPSWESSNGTQSWRKIVGTLKVNGAKVDNSNQPIHSSQTSYQSPHKNTEQKAEQKVDTKPSSQSKNSSVTATINREASKYPGNKNGYVADRAQGSDAFLNFAGKVWNKVKQGAVATWDYLDGPEEKIQTTTPSGPRRNIFTTGMKKIHGTFGNAYKTTPGSYGGGQFGGGGAGSTFHERPEYEEIKEKKQVLVPITTSRNRDEAFAQARKEGKKTFWFNGKEYTTEMGTGPASAAHDVESKTVLVPLEYTKNRKVRKEN